MFEYDRFEDNREGHFATFLVPRKTTEVNIKRLPPSEQKLFETADRAEWANVIRLGAVRVHRGAEALSSTATAVAGPNHGVSYCSAEEAGRG